MESKEAKGGDAEPKPKPADAEPKPKPADAEPKPKPADAEPKPKPADAEPKPKPADAEPKPKAADAEPKPKPADAEPKPADAGPKPKPADAEPKPKPKPVDAEPKPKPKPKPADAGPKPKPADAGPKPKGGHKKHKPGPVMIAFCVIALFSALALHFDWVRQDYLFGLLLVMTLGVLASEKLNKTILVMLSAGLCLFLAVGEGGLHATAHVEHWKIPQYIAMIDWGTIGIIVGSTVFVELISRSGLFAFTSVKIMKLSRGDPFLLLVAFSALTVVFSAFLNNVTAMIIVGSLTIVACRKLELNAAPFLLTEGIFTNIGGLLTLISSVPNIIVGTEAKISYLKFLVVAGPYCLVASVATIYMARWIFKVHRLESEMAQKEAQAQVERFDEWETVKDKKFFYISAGVLVAIILAFAFHSQIPVLNKMGLEVVAFIGATAMLVIYPTDVEDVLDRVEWSLIFFFIGLFALLGVMEHAGVLKLIGLFLEGPLNSGSVLGPTALIWASGLFSGLTDNIPLSAVLAKVLSGMGESGPSYMNSLWWALIFGAGLGGNLTTIGSASTVVAISIMKREGHAIGFLGYVKLAAPIVIMQLLLATGYLFLVRALGVLDWAI